MRIYHVDQYSIVDVLTQFIGMGTITIFVEKEGCDIWNAESGKRKYSELNLSIGCIIDTLTDGEILCIKNSFDDGNTVHVKLQKYEPTSSFHESSARIDNIYTIIQICSMFT